MNKPDADVIKDTFGFNLFSLGKNMKDLLNRTILYLLLAITGYGSYAYATQEGTQAEEPDYSETQWRTFYGEKPADYRPEFWVTYYGAEDKEECYRPNVVSLVDGESRIKKKIYKEFLAEESNGGKNYVIRYPSKFRLGNCIYSSGGGQLYIEEKSDDPRLTQEPYASKTQIYRNAIIRSGGVAVISLIRDSSVEREEKGKNYLNKLDYNVFCYKRDSENKFESVMTSKSLRCFSSSVENNIKKILAYNSYLSYTRDFWKENLNIEMNFKISKKNYCELDKYCQSLGLLPFDKNMLEPENFSELYQKGDE